MPVLSRSFRERDPVTVGVVGTVVTLALMVLLFQSGDIARSITDNSYTAQFPDAGNLQTGAEVRVSGVAVGSVTGISIEGDHVDVAFQVSPQGTLGNDTRAAIKSATALGSKFLALLPAGVGQMPDGATIPLSRTAAPYDIAQALGDFSGVVNQLDTGSLAKALTTVADTFSGTPDDLGSALTGVSRFSQTVASRDQTLRTLLSNTSTITDLLAQRSGQIVTLLTDGNSLLAELQARRDVIRQLLVNVTRTIDELNGLVKDNEKQLGPALDELKQVLDLLNRQSDNVSASIHGLNTYASSLGEAVSGGPWFFAFVPNLVPTNLIPLLPGVLGQSGPPGSTPAGPSLPVVSSVLGGAPASTTGATPAPTGAAAPSASVAPTTAADPGLLGGLLGGGG